MKNLILALASVSLMNAPVSDEPIESSFEEPEVSQVSSEQEETENERIDFKDNDGNGIPDVIENYYDEHIRDQYAFGIGLGALIGFSINACSILYMLHKNKKERESTKKVNTAKDELIDKQCKTIEYLVRKSEGYVDRFVETAESLPTYEGLSVKLDAILKNQLNIAASDKMCISSGIADEVIKNIEEVTSNEQGTIED